MILQPIPYEQVAPFRSRAARDHVSLSPTATTKWYGAFLDGDSLAGVCGLLIGRTFARIRGVWVPRELRGEGIGSAMTEALIEQAPRGLRLEVLAYNRAFYEARGFRVVGQPRAGVTRLIREPV